MSTSMIAVPQAVSRRVRKTITFDGSAGNGAVGTVAVFTVSGHINLTRLVAVCTVDLAGATATIQLGTVTFTGGIIGASTATNFVAGEIWYATNPIGTVATVHNMNSNMARQTILFENVQITVVTAAVTAGTLIFDAWWTPLTAGSTLT